MSRCRDTLVHCATSSQPLRLVGTARHQREAVVPWSLRHPHLIGHALVETARRLGGEQFGCKISMLAFGAGDAPRINLVEETHLQQPQRESRQRDPHAIAATIA